MTLVIPMVTWQDAREEWVVDIYSRVAPKVVAGFVDRDVERLLGLDPARERALARVTALRHELCLPRLHRLAR